MYFFVYRSIHVQDVILGLLRNCWKSGGVFYYYAVISYCYDKLDFFGFLQ